MIWEQDVMHIDFKFFDDVYLIQMPASSRSNFFCSMYRLDGRIFSYAPRFRMFSK